MSNLEQQPEPSPAHERSPVSDDLTQLRSKAERFEAILTAAFEQKYGTSVDNVMLPMLRRTSPVYRWPILDFLDTLTSSSSYQSDRIGKLIHLLFDLKLQLYYLCEVDLGLYNHLVFNQGYDMNRDNLSERPHVVLTRLSLDQNVIGKSRVLWERLMNFVFYMETGDNLEDRVSGQKSKRKIFGTFISTHPHWVFLSALTEYVDLYDGAYRTPEFHKMSILRAELLGGKRVDANSLISLINPVMEVFWDNLMSRACGGPIVRWVKMRQNPDGSFYPNFWTGDSPPPDGWLA